MSNRFHGWICLWEKVYKFPDNCFLFSFCCFLWTIFEIWFEFLHFLHIGTNFERISIWQPIFWSFVFFELLNLHISPRKTCKVLVSILFVQMFMVPFPNISSTSCGPEYWFSNFPVKIHYLRFKILRINFSVVRFFWFFLAAIKFRLTIPRISYNFVMFVTLIYFNKFNLY